MQSVLDSMNDSDWPEVRTIYLDGIATGNATFETEAPDWASWDKGHLSFARLVARQRNTVVGWATLSPVSARAAYAGVAEVSLYVSSQQRGMGIGRALLTRLIAESELNGIWTLQAGIFPENTPSIRLHLSLGFREVGRRERVGKLHGVWRDVVLLERRSSKIGLD
jgi:L-amino acid N-acyltransferase YncA